ncbi:hypothetical protein B0H14DRAFT_2996735 [Mycena olivaceomarginata]|nr:hypothetical protein B0H14DRAFT_2996735 [Mycena olivaceomarginata]
MSDTQHRLVTVNTVQSAPSVSSGRVVEDVKDRYTIVHVANEIEDVKETVEREKLDVLFTASMWTPEQARYFFHSYTIYCFQEIIPGLKTFSIHRAFKSNRESLNESTNACSDAVVE